MNSRKFVLLGCVVACVFAASTATAQMRGHAGSMGGMGMRGAPMSHSMGMRGGFMPNSMGRMPIQRGPMMNSPSGFKGFGDRNFNRNDRFGVVSMTVASLGLIDFIDSTTSTTSTTTTSITSSLSATSGFHGGGVGAGLLGAVGAGAIRTDTTAATTTATTVPVMDTAIPVDPESLNYRVGSLAPAIITALPTESWDPRLGEQ